MKHPIRYNAVLGALLLLLGLFTLGVGVVVTKPMLMFVGALNTFVGFGFTTRPFVVVTERGVEMKNLLGMTMRVHAVAREHLAVRGGSIVDARSGKKLTGGMLARREDLEALARALGGK